jgi:LemA protein
VQVRNNIDKAWKNIDVLLQQRHDELTKLIDTVSGYMQHEKTVLDGLTRLRVGYDGASSSDDKVRIENEMNREIARLRHTWEGYPDLKASQNYLYLQTRISTVESAIADRREFFNDSVNIFNIQIERFPDLWMARALGYARRSFLEVPEELKQDVHVKLG